MNLLVVEDERRMLELLRNGLVEEGHNVTCAMNGREGWEIVGNQEFDVVILDIMLPHLSGFELAKRMRAQHNATPILMLTARDSVPDIVQGLELGADDYMTKPFSFSELLLRLRAIRRRVTERGTRIQIGDLLLDRTTREVCRDGTRLSLTKTEYALLERLMCDAGIVVPREVLIKSVWGENSSIGTNTLDAFVRLLRQKIDIHGRSRLIHTVRGTGYVLRKELSA